MALNPWYDLEHPFRLMERNLFQPENIFANSPFNQIIQRDFFKPWDNVFRRWEDMWKPMEQLSAAMNQMAIKDIGSNVTADDEKFQVNVDVQHFAPQEVTVRVVDGHIYIEGKHEEKRDQHGYISRQFVRRYALPQGCLADTVESKLSSDGVLTVTAPRVLPLPSPGERIVPITHTGPVQKRIGSSEPMVEEVK